jgi:hypothetical protein
MYDLFPTRPAVALATPMTARYSRPALDFLSHCEFRGMTTCSMANKASVITSLFLPPSLCHYLPFFISTFRFLRYLSLILHFPYALSFLSHVPLTCIPSYLLNFLVSYFFSQLTTWEQGPSEAKSYSADQEIPSTVHNPQFHYHLTL